MSQFEYISIAVSLVLVFGVTRLLNGLPVMLRSERSYWVHSLWTAQALVNYAMFWWVFWFYRAIEEWTLGSYLITLIYPVLSYVAATILAPAEGTFDTDWRAHFYANRRVFFGLGIASGTTLGLVAHFLASSPLSDVIPLAGTFLLILAIGFAFASPRVQAGVVLANLVFIVAVYAPMIWS